ncbi:GNAT family N-acetyltransferase [Nostoc sp. 'Peltigera malacea cyanobiont' DB3992]|uniref:GNAT family N-acetyltransferase n=1 Tax=Nostoc sp. 'Peltigera malacea cyanobiont' DB3992 TaxID=1206980 RepID=UPI000C056613|nr:GNAT family N-acetyltransferase [Nostoc sp. 'Peltigera malacea cyanobiont' DB3992]PHM09270.1 GCN5-related N-acetyltransferase [Nostoc sp. 'Peltigera malacea cyanobiont' DB3992]
MSQYRFKQSFSDDPSLSDKLFNLMEVTFPGISSLAECARKLGASWETASTPFIRFHDDIAITHVGVLEIPMQIMGQRLTVGGVHGVATRAEYRRRGYYREVMEEVLGYCDRDRLYETLVLTTPQPEFYLPFGFRVVEEHIFKVKCNSTGSADSFRILDFTNTKDYTLLHRLLETRAPISNIVGVVNEKPVFCVNEGSRPLYYAEDLDLIACMEIEDNRLHLFDLVTTQICPLKNIISKIPQPIEEVVIYFSPELLDVKDVQAFTHTFDETVLMVRGKFAAEGEKFMLPRSARC